jgi:hypothetical protein
MNKLIVGVIAGSLLSVIMSVGYVYTGDAERRFVEPKHISEQMNMAIEAFEKNEKTIPIKSNFKETVINLIDKEYLKPKALKYFTENELYDFQFKTIHDKNFIAAYFKYENKDDCKKLNERSLKYKIHFMDESAKNQIPILQSVKDTDKLNEVCVYDKENNKLLLLTKLFNNKS